jgi:predicted RND superfamily exporter protein
MLAITILLLHGLLPTVRGALAVIVSLTLVPLWMLGGIGWFHVPIDVISAPATVVCIGIAIASMIHLVFGVRRAEANGTTGWAAWVAAREEQWRGIVYSDVIMLLALPSSSSLIFRRRNGLVWSSSPAALSTFLQTSSS